MSGDVQPRKRKDKKRKKDDLGVEEHRGTAATFGEGDVMMHSHQDHGTGGHWCAKIIFFSLLAVLVTLIGLIILENRGLTELEANQVETQYSGILDGWIEEAPDDDHHDEHTLELKHHEHDDELELEHEEDIENQENDDDEILDEDEADDDNENDEEDEMSNDIEQDDEDDGENDEDEDEMSNDVEDDENQLVNDEQENEGDDDNDNDEDDDDNDQDEDVIEETRYDRREDDDDEDDNDGDNDIDNDDDDDNRGDESKEEAVDYNELKDDKDDDDDDDEDEDNKQSDENEYDDNDDDDSHYQQDDEDDEHEEDHGEEVEAEVEKIEKEVSDEDEPEPPQLPVPDVSVEKDTSVEAMSPDEDEADGQDYLEADELDEPTVERIAPPPPGQPYAEIEEEQVSTENPRDTLAEEEEYERQQKQLRQQEEQSSSHIWLKLAVGGALLVATHAVLRRATAPRDTPENEQEEHASREETPLSDRRMTLLPAEAPKVVPPQSFQAKVEEEVIEKASSLVKTTPVVKQESEEVEEDEEEVEDQAVQVTKDTVNKELYSDEDENEVDEEVEEEEEVEEKVEAPKPVANVAAVKKEEESEPEDVEIIDDEPIEEEIDEEIEDEEEISDVDDAELLNRLEAKYGRLPEPERPGQRHKDGGNSIEDEWPGEPSDAFWREQLQKAEQDLRQGAFGACAKRLEAAELAGSARALWLRAHALDMQAESLRDNRVLAQAIAAYLQLLKMNERLSDRKLRKIALRTIDRMHFRGAYLNAEPVYKLLIRRFPNDVTYRNNLTISFLMANRADLASEVLKETLRLWPDDRLALAHYGFVLKTEQKKLEEAVPYFQKALEGDAGPANEPRFYYHLGDALLTLGRTDEAREVHERGAALGHFLSPAQRSLYNVARLKSQPWWDVKKTPYAGLARLLESSWREILQEAEAARELYEQEKEGLRERGEWSQLDVLVRGREVGGRCARAPVTCAAVRSEPAALCRRGQVKFSALSGGTHVRAHVGPTNCRLRMHLALANTDRTYIRVDREIRQWEVGKVLMFDDSFEHEVWHNGTGTRLVLIVDVWHPALTPHERRTLPAI